MDTKPGTREQREQRQAEALKANLRRRKDRARAQSGAASKTESAAAEPHEAE